MPVSICNLTCKGKYKTDRQIHFFKKYVYQISGNDVSVSRACEWQCKLNKHETGQCQDQSCVCQGLIDEDEDLFEDVTDENNTVEVLP